MVERGGGPPIAGATVRLERAPEPAAGGELRGLRTAVTDDEGTYAFDGLGPGEYRLRISRLGYREMTLWLELPPSWSVRRSVGLRVEPVELEPVRLTLSHTHAAWPRGPAGVGARVPSTSARIPSRPTLDARALTPEQVQDMASLGEPDLFRALQRLPGVSGRGDFSAMPWVRGAPWSLTQVTLDGLPLYDPLHLAGAGTGLASEGLEAAYLLPGARPASLSEGAAGAIRLVSRTARSGGRARLAASPIAVRAHAEDRWLDDRLGLSLTGRRSWWDVLDPGLLGSGPVDYHFTDALARLDLRLGESGSVEVGGFWEEDELEGDVGDLIWSSRGRWGNRLGWVAAERRFGDHGIRATVGGSDYSLRTRPRPWASLRSLRGVPALDAVELELSRQVLRLEVGGRPRGIPLEWGAGLERATDRLWQSGAEAWDRDAPGVDDPAETLRGLAWAEGTVRLGSFELSAGAAVDLTNDMPLPGSGLRPGLRARWHPSDRLTVEMAHSRNRQFVYPLAPAGRSVGPALGVGHVWILAGPDRPPMTSDAWTLGLETRPAPRMTAALTAFRRRTTGLWTRGVSTLVGGARDLAAPEGTPGSEGAHGIEAVLRREDDRFAGEISYTWLEAEVEGEPGRLWPSPAERRHSLDAMVSSRLWRGLRGTILFRGESGWPYAPGPWVCEPGDSDCASDTEARPTSFAFSRSEAYASLDLLVGWTSPGERVRWRVVAGLRNLLGQDNPAAYRSDTCFGGELISTVCERAIGAGEFSSGFSGVLPTVSLAVEF